LKAIKDKLLGVTIAKRSIWHFMRTIFLFVLIILLCVGAFLTAMHVSNLYILTTEGLQMRAECILQEGSLLELGEYFTTYFIENDRALYEGTYDNYTVSGFDYRFEVSGIRVTPWAKEASVVVVERMERMQGSINSSAIPADAPKDAEFPLPAWEEGEYRVHYVRLNDRWFISEMEYLGQAPEAKPKPTPAPISEGE